MIAACTVDNAKLYTRHANMLLATTDHEAAQSGTGIGALIALMR
jgi:hypothetical protein